MSIPAALVLGFGLGVLAYPLFAIGSALVAAVLHEKYTRVDQL